MVKKESNISAVNFYADRKRKSALEDLEIKKLEFADRSPLSAAYDTLKLLKKTKFDTVLEIGAERGTNLIILKDYLDYNRGISVDVFDPIDKWDALSYLNCSIYELSDYLPEQSVDLVLMSEIIEHLCETDTAIVEVYKILKKGGLLVITTPNLVSLINRFMILYGSVPLWYEVSYKKVFGRILTRDSNPVGHVRLFTPRALDEFLTYYGFKKLTLYTMPTSFNKTNDRFNPLRTINRLEKFILHFNNNLGTEIVGIFEKS